MMVTGIVVGPRGIAVVTAMSSTTATVSTSAPASSLEMGSTRGGIGVALDGGKKRVEEAFGACNVAAVGQ